MIGRRPCCTMPVLACFFLLLFAADSLESLAYSDAVGQADGGRVRDVEAMSRAVGTQIDQFLSSLVETINQNRKPLAAAFARGTMSLAQAAANGTTSLAQATINGTSTLAQATINGTSTLAQAVNNLLAVFAGKSLSASSTVPSDEIPQRTGTMMPPPGSVYAPPHSQHHPQGVSYQHYAQGGSYQQQGGSYQQQGGSSQQQGGSSQQQGGSSQQQGGSYQHQPHAPSSTTAWNATSLPNKLHSAILHYMPSPTTITAMLHNKIVIPAAIVKALIPQAAAMALVEDAIHKALPFGPSAGAGLNDTEIQSLLTSLQVPQEFNLGAKPSTNTACPPSSTSAAARNMNEVADRSNNEERTLGQLSLFGPEGLAPMTRSSSLASAALQIFPAAAKLLPGSPALPESMRALPAATLALPKATTNVVKQLVNLPLGDEADELHGNNHHGETPGFRAAVAEASNLIQLLPHLLPGVAPSDGNTAEAAETRGLQGMLRGVSLFGEQSSDGAN